MHKYKPPSSKLTKRKATMFGVPTKKTKNKLLSQVFYTQNFLYNKLMPQRATQRKRETHEEKKPERLALYQNIVIPQSQMAEGIQPSLNEEILARPPLHSNYYTFIPFKRTTRLELLPPGTVTNHITTANCANLKQLTSVFTGAVAGVCPAPGGGGEGNLIIKCK